MKVKIKLTADQFKHLVLYLDRTVGRLLNEMQILNIRLFVAAGYKKIIDLQSVLKFSRYKIKTFAIEINQYDAILTLMSNDPENMDAYTLAIFTTMQGQSKAILTAKF